MGIVKEVNDIIYKMTVIDYERGYEKEVYFNTEENAISYMNKCIEYVMNCVEGKYLRKDTLGRCDIQLTWVDEYEAWTYKYFKVTEVKVNGNPKKMEPVY